MDDEITLLGPDALPEEWLARIKPELAPGERLIWAGQSRPGRELSGRWVATLYAAGFATLGAVGFAGFFGFLGPRFLPYEGGLAVMGFGGGSIAFLILIGLISHLIDARSERRVLAGNLYALTDSQAITWTPSGKAVTVQSTRRGSIKSVHRVELADGSGSVLFDNAPTSPYGLGAGFHDIPDTRRVEALVRLHLIGDDRTPSA